jgi:imidazole glycerol-phosphate synthase subunit HisF
MLRTRVVPCLLLSGPGLVKTRRFRDPRYVGDPINAVKLFNDKEVDELVFLDITATARGSGPPFELLGRIASEAFMPFCYGGGITTVAQVQQLLAMGVEKVSLNTAAHADQRLVTEASQLAGAQSVVVAIDVARDWLGRERVVTDGGRKKLPGDPVATAVRMQEAGAGELLVTSVDREGTGKGYDLDLISRIARAVDIPVVANGGASGLADLRAARLAGASAVAAGSLFVFVGPHRAVLINYPTQAQLAEVLS